ncbi:hypothetical protein [Ruegeria sp. MALMAid1280]
MGQPRSGTTLMEMMLSAAPPPCRLRRADPWARFVAGL